MKTLLLIDANSLIHRTFHALPPLSAPDGRPTQSLYGVANVLLKIWREEKPEYAAACFDRPEPTFRKKMFEAYKAHRPKAPDELVSQIIEARNLFEKFGVKVFEAPGFEADDLIATLAEKFRAERGVRVVVLTGDMDTLQLVEGDKVVVRTFRKGVSDTMIYDVEAVKNRFGLLPAQLPDYKALVGDPSDNIPGIPGVGQKTASALLQKYGTLESLLRNSAREPKLIKVAGLREAVEFSKSLVLLHKNAPIGIHTIEDLAVSGQETIRAYFLSLGFDSLTKRMSAAETGEKIVKPLPSTLFAEKKEDTGNSKNTIVLPSADATPENLASDRAKVGFDIKRALKDLWEARSDAAPPYFDLGVAFWLLDPDAKNYTPEAIYKKTFREKWGGSSADTMRLYSASREQLSGAGLLPLFEETEMPVLRVLAEMEAWGIAVSRNKLEILEKKIAEKLEGLVDKIYQLAGESFNINSPQQLGYILFEKLKITTPRARKTPGGQASTRSDVLQEILNSHPIVPIVVAYREDFKIQSTYVSALQELLGSGGRLHTEFVQTGTATGRISSQNPNLQNIPRESAWSSELRSAFEAIPGHTLLSFDYSQIDLRSLAASCRDPQMIDAFERNLDIHQMTASKVFNVPFGEVRPEMRRVAKTLNFGLIYGMGPRAFAETSGMNIKAASEFIASYFREFPEVKAWQERVKRDARNDGYVETLTGRRRYLPNIRSGSPRFVAEAERAAINQPVQGLSADITKFAMISAKKALAGKKWWGTKAKLLLTIHDELLFEVADDIIDTAEPMIREAMEHAYELPVPLRVEVMRGKHWGAMHA